MKIIGNDWDQILEKQFNQEYYQKLRSFLDYEYEHYTIYPKAPYIYNALRLCSYKDTKVLILGQDPYHEPNQANGLAFSVNDNTKLPPSLVNIYKELESDLNIKKNLNGNLSSWAKQGVLLLNAVLTVREHEAASHSNKGWELLTDEIIKKLNEKEEQLVFILWGGYARKKKIHITNSHHLVIESAHPSPLSAYNGFFNSKPFSKTNNFLIQNNRKPINW